MATYTAAQATLASIADVLSDSANDAGLTTLSSDLSSFSTEIGQSVTEDDFFGIAGSGSHGGLAKAWADILNSAAIAIDGETNTSIDDNLSSILDEITTIDNHLNRMQSVIIDLTGSDNGYGRTGPHTQNIGTYWLQGASGIITDAQVGRALVINSLSTEDLEALITEINSPTDLSGGS